MLEGMNAYTVVVVVVHTQLFIISRVSKLLTHGKSVKWHPKILVHVMYVCVLTFSRIPSLFNVRCKHASLPLLYQISGYVSRINASEKSINLVAISLPAD